MPVYMVAATAAVAIVGANLFSTETWSRSPRPRLITEFGMTGSAVGGDTTVELEIDETRIGSFFNTRAGAGIVPNKDDMFPLERLYIPAGAELRCVVRDGATTEIVRMAIGIEDQ